MQKISSIHKARIAQLADDNPQKRHEEQYPRAGIPDLITADTTSTGHFLVRAYFHGTPEQAAADWLTNVFRMRFGMDISASVTVEQTGDYLNDWVEASVVFQVEV